jgi:predicted transcriptional regulator
LKVLLFDYNDASKANRWYIYKVNIMFTFSRMADAIRKTRTFRLDERVVAGLNDLAKKKNASANRLLENLLIQVLKDEQILAADFESLGETRGREVS